MGRLNQLGRTFTHPGDQLEGFRNEDRKGVDASVFDQFGQGGLIQLAIVGTNQAKEFMEVGQPLLREGIIAQDLAHDLPGQLVTGNVLGDLLLGDPLEIPFVIGELLLGVQPSGQRLCRRLIFGHGVSSSPMACPLDNRSQPPSEVAGIMAHFWRTLGMPAAWVAKILKTGRPSECLIF